MKWTACRVASRQIIKDEGDYVIVRENLEPHPEGPILVRTYDDREMKWAVYDVYEPKAPPSTGNTGVEK